MYFQQMNFYDFYHHSYGSEMLNQLTEIKARHFFHRDEWICMIGKEHGK